MSTVVGLEQSPLVVDLDGTLIRTDMLLEDYFGSATTGVSHHASCVASLLQGKAALKAYLAGGSNIDYTNLPYDPSVLSLINLARVNGRPVYLATASDRRHAMAIADHLQLFDGVFASDGHVNLSSAKKADLLTTKFGHRGFDYVGNSSDDLAVWASSRKAYAIGTTARVARALEKLDVPIERLPVKRGASLRTWVKAIRVHQYAKNALVFVPLLTSHIFSAAMILHTLIAFVAFSACASAVYLINDLLDIEADRHHPSKRNRAFASGAIPILHGMIVAPIFLLVALGCGLLISLPFTGVLVTYFALTTAYSVSLKRKMLIDTVVLAMLYTIRVIGGAFAINLFVSQWLLAFSMFIFFSLALVKRYVELQMCIEKGLPDPSNRNYRMNDSSIVAALAAASGFNAVTIFALYVSSPDVEVLYRRPAMLWLMAPIFLYWIGRMLMMAHRRLMHDDPIIFALRDRNSLLALVSMVILVLAAS